MVKTIFLEIAETIPVMLLICEFAVDFNFFTANPQMLAERNRFANPQTKTWSSQFSDLRTGLQKYQALPVALCLSTGVPQSPEVQPVQYRGSTTFRVKSLTAAVFGAMPFLFDLFTVLDETRRKRAVSRPKTFFLR